MAKWLCVCGNVIRSSGEIPNKTEWLLISDVRFDELYGKSDDVTGDFLYANMVHMWRCPVSDHLYVFWDGLGREATLYDPHQPSVAPETGG